ncbi:MAG TPA: hypothetical protein VGP26_21155 [Actinophytocola sp.]|nr:hypothetical protein [Actinophytocola sp.]
MLGTGIASADEDVNPDRPASPLDGSVRVPVHFDNNALGTPLGQKSLPVINKELRVSAADLAGAAPVAGKAAPAAAPVVGKVEHAAAPVVDTVSAKVDPTLAKVEQQARPVLDKAKPLTDKFDTTTAKAGIPPLPTVPHVGVPHVTGAFEGNRVDGDLVVPVDVSGNAIALLGKAEVENDSYQSYADSETVMTDGRGGFVSGNVVDLDWALPVQVTGNAIAGLGRASSTSTAGQDTSVTSDVVTDGSDGVLSGNVVAGHWATPAQLTGNAIGGAGRAQSDSQADTTATSGGTVLTSGADSLGSGNIGAAPIATPLEGNGNGIAGLGKADASSESTATATAGALRDGLYGVPTYLETNGDPAVGAGNIVEPAVSGPALLCGNAGAAAGGATADCASDSQTTAGGTTRSTGEGSVLSGAAATAPVAAPAEAFGNAAAGVGNATAAADNTVAPTAGGDSYTRGHDSLASGTVASAAPSGPVDVFGNSAAGAGAASSTATQAADTNSSGHTGTTGDNSLGGGNTATAPLSAPVEGFGNVAAAAGGADATASEVKSTVGDGGGSTDDDNGWLASNNVTTPVAGAAQAFGNGAGAVAFTDSNATTDTEVTSGGDSEATGTAGLGSGNIGQAPVSVPAQVFGTGASALAGGEQTAGGTTTTTAGGDAMTDGQDGVGSGNVVSGPVGSAGQAFGESAAALGVNSSDASSETSSTSGGTVDTDGTSGLGTGNVVSPQALPVAQSFAAAASGVGGVNSAAADSTSTATSGGDMDTAGDEGFLAGNLVDVPAGAVAQPFGDAVSAAESYSQASGDGVSDNTVGGTSTTSGAAGSLSGIDGTVPVGADAPIYDVPVEVLAAAVADSSNVSDLSVGEGASQLDLPVNGGGMSPTDLPTFVFGRSAQRDLALPTDRFTPFAGAFSGVLDGFAGGMAGVPGQDQVSQVTDAVAEYHTLPAPLPKSGADNPFPAVSGDLFEGVVAHAVEIPGAAADGLGGSRSARDLPTGNLPTGNLPLAGTPLSDIPLEELPVSDELADLPGTLPAVPAAAAVPGVPALPAGDLTDATTVLPAVPAVAGVPAVPAVPVVPAVPALPAGDLTDATTVLPAVPALGDLTDVTTQLPAVPAVPAVAAPADLPAVGDADVTEIVPNVPSVGDVSAVPVVQAPSLNNLPVDAPALPAANPASVLDDGSLSVTRAALANLFTVHPIA